MEGEVEDCFTARIIWFNSDFRVEVLGYFVFFAFFYKSRLYVRTIDEKLISVIPSGSVARESDVVPNVKHDYLLAV